MKRLALLLFATASLSLSAQQPRFGEKVDVNLVLIDAVVTDPKGNQILGLGKDDFVVTENGEHQKIDSVEYFTNRKLLDAREESAPFKVEQLHENRYFVFFFDKPGEAQLWDSVTSARNAAKRFVESLRPGDQVAVAGHDVRLKVYSDFTADKAQLLRAIDDAGSFGQGIMTGDGPILKTVDAHRMMSGSGTVYEALEVLADALHSTRGRKNLVLFSAGILEPGQEVRDGIAVNESRYYRPMLNALNESNVSIYAISLLRDGDAPPVFHQTLEQVSAATNGSYYRYAVNFIPLLSRIERETNGYYLISYYSNHPKGESGFQKVKVRTSADLRVKARAGYVYGE
jgi:VWFA-related protein